MATGFRNRRVNDMVVVRLTHKYAEVIDDVDLSQYHVGETLELRAHDASLLIAEGWAEPITGRQSTHLPAERDAAADSNDQVTSKAGLARETKPRR
jgi:hypothetical protein